jgi:hypothetical protein
MREIFLIVTATATLAASTALARQDPASYPRYSMGSPPALNPAFKPTEDVRHREQRARIAASLIRDGRCDDAARLAKRQGDGPMLSRINAVCGFDKAADLHS